MDSILKAVQILKSGGVVVYPTDTAYGLAVDATNAKAVKKLYQIKGRDFNKPIHVIFPDGDWLEKLVELNDAALNLINKFFPGPLTLVLPLKAKGRSWQMLSAKTGTLGVRKPNNEICLRLVEEFGHPITTTSANVSNMPTCYSVAEVKKQFAKAKYKPDYYLNGGNLPNLLPSTVVSLIKDVKILRVGTITEKQIKNALK